MEELNMTELQNEIEAIVNEGEQAEDFTVTSMEDAITADSRIMYHKGKQQEIEGMVKSQVDALESKIARLKEWGEEAKEPYLNKERFYTHRLEFFLRDQLNNGLKKKSIELPNVKLKMVKQQPEFTKDEDMLFKYAKANEMVKVKESTDWTAVKKAGKVVGNVLIDENGEQIPGVEVMPRPDKFSIEVVKWVLNQSR